MPLCSARAPTGTPDENGSVDANSKGTFAALLRNVLGMRNLHKNMLFLSPQQFSHESIEPFKKRVKILFWTKQLDDSILRPRKIYFSNICRRV